LNKISGPLLDRIDIQIEASPVKYGELNAETKTESSQDIRERVNLARKIQKERYQGLPIHSNSQLTPSLINKYCEITDKAQTILASAYERLSLSVRAHNKIIKVARTIADLEQKNTIDVSHIAEAIQYRSINSKYFG
jgi:magnesium chelatase family protein